MNLKKEELLKVVGGINITAAFLSAIKGGIDTVLDLGRSLGTSIRRIVGRSICSI